MFSTQLLLPDPIRLISVRRVTDPPAKVLIRDVICSVFSNNDTKYRIPFSQSGGKQPGKQRVQGARAKSTGSEIVSTSSSDRVYVYLRCSNPL